jgi:predicted nucleic acid-binding protein
MREADGWYMCRVGFVEVMRAVSLAAGRGAAGNVAAEWPAFGVVEVDEALVESAAKLSVARDLRSLDALHLAAALVLPREDLLLATWDRRLHMAAGAEGLAVVPLRLDG